MNTRVYFSSSPALLLLRALLALIALVLSATGLAAVEADTAGTDPSV